MQRVSLLFRGLCAVGILALVGSLFHAATSQAEPPVAPRAQVEAYLKKVATLTPSERALVEVATERAKAALKKATGAAPDPGAASEPIADGPRSHYEAAALEWVLAAEDLWRAAKQEAEAAALENKLQEARAELTRARALLEATQARKGRLEAQLKREESTGSAGAGGE